jgi:DNA-binding response OmpR family regulator
MGAGAATGLLATGRAPVRSALMPVVLLATDADQLHDEVDAALGDEQTTVHRVHTGREVIPAVKALEPDLVILDLQIGNMGGMATCLSLRSEEGAGRLARRPVMMLLDRVADVFLARRSDADGWLVKPLDAIRIRRAAEALLAGGEHREGVGVVPTDEIEPMNVVVPEAASVENPAEPESGMASKLTESAVEADDTADERDEADNAEAAEG